MRIFKTATKEVKLETDILCNLCGNSCYRFCDYEFAHLEYHGGFDCCLADGYWVELDICDECLRDKILPLVKIHTPENAT